MNKKKLILLIGGGLLVLLLAAAFVAVLNLDRIVKTGVESVGPRLTRTTVSLDGVSIRPFRGFGEIKGLEIGNPAGYEGEFAIRLGNAHLDLDPGSLTAEKVVIESMLIEGAEVILEGGLKDNNLTAIQKNVAEFSGTQEAAPADEPADQQGASKKLEVRQFRIAGAKVHLRLSAMAGRNVTLIAPDIVLSDLGTGPEGITVAELVQRAIKQLTDEVILLAGREAAKAGTEALKDAAEKGAGEAVNQAAEGLKNLFQKKQ
ncbi:MAG TPA: hypothetical protein DCY13_20010 [Verrucomicrobiales bacterium]|nr:hypothetical protein [Verrucomicrobiales bacterium]